MQRRRRMLDEEERSVNSSVLIYRAVSTVTRYRGYPTLTTGCLTSVWILTSVWKADLTVTRVSNSEGR
ncbi:hypothetical protein OS493_040642 [Desmophyllum pertusum]|uniref:Uncharacterized protein n=1 Tax=Desmophyllum pertusum TaxID=174260 RepID=A0A9X0CD79_9CNID|nr:hypothetical protein OS493_040642 [Desmophyllum pertusum]